MRLCLVRGSTSGSFSVRFFFDREIYWQYRGITSGSFLLSRERYWQVRGSSSLRSEIFGGDFCWWMGGSGGSFIFFYH